MTVQELINKLLEECENNEKDPKTTPVYVEDSSLDGGLFTPRLDSFGGNAFEFTVVLK